MSLLVASFSLSSVVLPLTSCIQTTDRMKIRAGITMASWNKRLCHSIHETKNDRPHKSCKSIYYTNSYLVSNRVIQGDKGEIFPAEDLGHFDFICSWFFKCFGLNFTAWVMLLLSENCAQWSRESQLWGREGTEKGPVTRAEEGSDTERRPRHLVQHKHVVKSCTECTGVLYCLA